jgi:hypothetical protein
MNVRRLFFVFASALVPSAGPARAAGNDATHACVEAAHEGQRLRDAGRPEARATPSRGAGWMRVRAS